MQQRFFWGEEIHQKGKEKKKSKEIKKKSKETRDFTFSSSSDLQGTISEIH